MECLLFYVCRDEAHGFCEKVKDMKGCRRIFLIQSDQVSKKGNLSKREKNGVKGLFKIVYRMKKWLKRRKILDKEVNLNLLI